VTGSTNDCCGPGADARRRARLTNINYCCLTDSGDGARPQTATRLMAPANEGVAGEVHCWLREYVSFRGVVMPPEELSLVELRCAVAVVRADGVLLLQRLDHGDWVLPGGCPRQHESMGSCARREIREETGLDVHPSRCALVLEVNDPVTRRRTVELVFVAHEFDTSIPVAGDPGRRAAWVGWDELRRLKLRPPIAGFLPDLARRRGEHARYLGKMWRPAEACDDQSAAVDHADAIDKSAASVDVGEHRGGTTPTTAERPAG
jgi:8-oxo-dGTP diphosphatase